MSITQNTEYLSEGLSRLLQQFKNKPRIASWLKSYLNECQELENAMWDVFANRVIQDGLATDDLLDKLGKIVGQDRQGFSDEEYRNFIQARIKANRSDGKRETLITIASLLAPNITIYVKETPSCKIYMQPQGALPVSPKVIFQQFLSPAVSAGTLLVFVWTQESWDNTIHFQSFMHAGTYPDPTADQSPGSIHIGSGDNGGVLAGVFQGKELIE